MRVLASALLLLFVLQTVHASNNWSGVNSYFIWGLSDSDRAAHLRALANANIRIIRIFVVHIGQGDKGSTTAYVPDVEEKQVGFYQDDILNRIDKLMQECAQLGLKLNLVLHDRYSTGWWQSDAYASKYGGGKNPVNFYRNGGGDFDNRIRHILAHRNPHFNNRPWSDLHEVIWAFGIQNEGRSYMPDFKDPWTWHCNRARVIRPLISNKIYITTGGGATWADSLQEANFQCQQIDIVGIHSYEGFGYLKSNLAKAINKAKQYNKKIIYEEFGLTGEGMNGDISNQGKFCNDMGVPWFPWQFIHARPGDYEYFTNSNAWNTHVRLNNQANQVRSVFDWGNFNYSSGGNTTGNGGTGNGGTGNGGTGDGGNGGNGKGDWEFCTTSSQCRNSCCSKEHSDDGKFKCTPGGSQCKSSPTKGDWSFCSRSSECYNGCCSKQHSDDGKLKCTPGGGQCQ